MSRVLPILFNTEMVRAILDGRKTVTRRLVKPRYQKNEYGFEVATNKVTGQRWVNAVDEEGFMRREILPPYEPGDILYVRETWCNANIEGVEPDYYYYADVHICEDYNRTEWKWHPSIHMPKKAARIWLKVTDVRVERLQEITEEQAYREGVIKAHDDSFNRDYWYYKEGQNYLTGNVWTESARQCFLWGIWNGTLKKTDYDRYCNNANPWVWVIEFERCEKPEREE